MILIGNLRSCRVCFSRSRLSTAAHICAYACISAHICAYADAADAADGAERVFPVKHPVKHEQRPNAVAKIEELLAYRLPQSGNRLSTIVLTRGDAEEILRHIVELERKITQS